MPGSGRPKSGHPNRRTALDAQNGGPPPGKMLIFQCSEAGTDRTDMAKSAEPVTIKKYANRRLYNTGTSTYVTLEDLASLVKKGEDFVVYDAKTGEEITRSVLAQIIFEQENKEGQNLLPIAFLRQLIRFYGDGQQMAQAFGVGTFGPLEDQVRRNMEMFERAFAMFAPFARREGQAAEEDKSQAPGTEIDELKRQLSEMQKRLDRLTGGEKQET